MKRLVLIPLSLFSLVGTPATAQTTGTLAGSVTSVGGVPLAAAQVFLPGAGIGTLTNDAGRFLLLNVPSGETQIRVELLGYRSGTRFVTVRSGETTTVDVTLTPAPISLDEVVVTGTGRATERRKLGNTVATLDASSLQNAPVTSFSELLQAREPSVVALTSDGHVGSGTRIRIRGSNSLTMSNEPLVYVDGLRVDNSGDLGEGGTGGDRGSPLDDINWESVERVEILKGAAAATLYGSEASSGVIQVFTKRGAPGPARITLRSEVGISRYPDALEPQVGFARDADQAAALSELYGMELAPFQVFERDFVGDLFETGHFQTLSGQVSGGVDEILYHLSARYAGEDGPIGGESLGPARDEVRRLQLNTSLTFQPRDELTFRVTAGYTDTHLEPLQRNNNISSATSVAMGAKPERADCSASAVEVGATFGSHTPRCTGPGNPWGAPPGLGTPRELLQNEQVVDTRHFTGSLHTSWSGAWGLSARGTVGIDQVDQRWDSLWPFGWRVDGVGIQIPPEGLRDLKSRTHREITVDGAASWSADLGVDFTSSLTAGGQIFLTDEWGSGTFVAQFPSPGVIEVQSAEFQFPESFSRSKVGLGGYVQEQLGFRDWLFATVGTRFDRTSAFGSDAGSAVYPKASLSASLSDLPSWNVPWLPTLRLRAAVGQAGLQPGAFDKLTTFTPLPTAGGPGIEPENVGNADLRPERATEVEVGVDAELLDGRIGFDVTFWDRSTADALILTPFPAAGGFLEPQLENIGRLDAHGLELSLRANPVERSHLSVSLFGSAAYLSETITDLGGTPPVTVSGNYTRHRNAIVEGYAPGSFFGARLIPVCGPDVDRRCYTPGATVPYDSDGDGQPDTEEAFRTFLTSMDQVTLDALAPLLDDEDGDGDALDHYLGKPVPDWQGSVGADIALGSRLSLSTLFEFRVGHEVANLTEAFRNSHPLLGRNVRETAEVESTLLDPATRSDADARFASAMKWANELISLFPYSGLNLVERGDMVRWRELSLTYRVPAAWAGAVSASDLSLTLTGRNLAVWTAYSGTDPEANELGRCGSAGEAEDALQCNFLDGSDFFTLPLPRRFGLALRVVF